MSIRFVTLPALPARRVRDRQRPHRARDRLRPLGAARDRRHGRRHAARLGQRERRARAGRVRAPDRHAHQRRDRDRPGAGRHAAERDAGLLVHEDGATFPDIAPGGSATSAGPGFTVTAPADRTCLDTLTFDLDIVDEAGTRALSPWTVDFGSTQTADDLRGQVRNGQGLDEGGRNCRSRYLAARRSGGDDRRNPPGEPGDRQPQRRGVEVLRHREWSARRQSQRQRRRHRRLHLPIVSSPSMDYTGYKRVVYYFDLWLYRTHRASPRTTMHSGTR